MPPRLKAPVEPALLIWARNSAALSLDDAARKIGVAVERVQEWESGTDSPTIPQLKRAATVYKRPLAVLFLSAPPNELGFDAIRDFRRLDPALGQAFSPQLAFEVRAAIERRTIALDVCEALGQPPAEFRWRAAVTDDPEAVAAAVRAHLGLRLEEQYRWRDASKAFKIWR
jgi:transcriptional regulator with XRE-family HTH domain